LFVLAVLFAYLTTVHPSFNLPASRAASVLSLGSAIEPWHLAWLRVLYTVAGVMIAFVVGVVLWPARAREGLQVKVAESGRHRTVVPVG
jgi:hypothetical protein